MRHWRIVLRCPDCESRREGVFEQAAVELLDDELDRAAGALLGDLRRMTHANMSEEVDFFVRALDADLIYAFRLLRLTRRGCLSVALDDRVGDQVRAAPRARRAGSRQRRLRLGDDRQRALARLVQSARRGDPLAQLLGLLGACSARRGRSSRAPARARARG